MLSGRDADMPRLVRDICAAMNTPCAASRAGDAVLLRLAVSLQTQALLNSNFYLPARIRNF